MFAARLKKARDAKGLTQLELATSYGWRGSTMIGRYEIGMGYPTLAVAVKLADILGVSLDWLAGRVG